MAISTVFKSLEKAEKTTGLYERQAIVQGMHDKEKDLASKVFLLVFNPDYTFNVNERISYKPATKNKTSFDEFLMLANSLNERVLTGNAAAEAVNNFLCRCDSLHSKWYERILKKDLRAGLGASLIEQCFTDVRKTERLFIEPALAEEFNSKKLIKSTNWLITPKIDGLRLFLCYKNGILECISRANKSYSKISSIFLPDIKAIHSAYKKDFVLDVEVFSTDWNNSMTVVLTDDKDEIPEDILKKLKLNVLDFLDYTEMETHTCSRTQEERFILIESIIKSGTFQFVTLLQDKILLSDLLPIEKQVELKLTQDYSSIEKEVQTIIDKYASMGYEGVVFREMGTPYQFKRHWSWMKGKKFYTTDVKVIGYTVSKKRPGEIRNLQIITPEGKTLSISSGLTQKQRKEFFADPNKIVGKTLEIQYQKASDTSLVIPSILRIREDK